MGFQVPWTQVVILVAACGHASGHGAMSFPTPRNAIDASLPPFQAWGYPCDSTHQGVNCTMTFCSAGRNCESSILCRAFHSRISHAARCRAVWFASLCACLPSHTSLTTVNTVYIYKIRCTGQGACPKSAHNGQVDALTASNGQSCYWFSNGCTVGCDQCDGTNNHIGHGFQQFLSVLLPCPN